MTQPDPVLIVGAGIVGAGIFRDLALHGVPCLLIDKKDFSSQTSGSSSKMLHGGIRYLESLNFKLVSEALRERNLWLRLAPHLCREEFFCLPVYRNGPRPLPVIHLGLTLYHLLGPRGAKKHSILSAQETLQKFPFLKPQNLRGAGLYRDAIVDDSKMTLEIIYDGLLEPNARALNYVELAELSKDGRARLRDTLTGKEHTVRVSETIFAAGPFTDQLLNRLQATAPWSPKLSPSKGSHLWFSREDFPVSRALLLTPQDKRAVFVIPYGRLTLTGTTEVPARGDFFDPRISEEEIDYLLARLTEFFPKLNLRRDMIRGSFAGVRPLLKGEESVAPGSLSREHKIFRPGKSVHVIVGGKYTTFRTMGQDISREICLARGLPYNSEQAARPLRQKSVFPPFLDTVPSEEKLMAALERERPRTREDLIRRRVGERGRSLLDNPSPRLRAKMEEVLVR